MWTPTAVVPGGGHDPTIEPVKPRSRWVYVAGGVFALVVAGQAATLIEGRGAGQLNSQRTRGARFAARRVDPGALAGLRRERFVKPYLKDPDSAKFRGITFRKRHGLPILCGEVNAKNSFGGYKGFQPFIAVGNVVQIGDGDHARSFNKLWNGFCVDTDADDVARHKGSRRHEATAAT